MLFLDLEVFLAYAAKRAYPIRRKVFKCCTRLYSAVRISHCWIIYVSADYANIFFHFLS